MKIDRYRALFVIASFIFLLDIVSLAGYSLISDFSVVLNLLISILFIAYAIIYLTEKYAGNKKCQYILFASIVVIYFLNVIFSIFYLHADRLSQIYSLILLLSPILQFVPCIILVFLARSLYVQKVPAKYKNRIKWLSYMLYFLAIVFLIVSIIPGIAYKANPVHLDDGGFMILGSANALVNGRNPYTINFSAQLYANLSKTVEGLTPTTKDTITGVMTYPALSFLIYVPAIIISRIVSSGNYSGFYSLFVIFAFILIFTASYVLKDDHIKSPPIAVILFLIITFSLFTTINDFLIISIMIFAVYKIESKYLWILLGLLASLQQITWIFVGLILIYKLRNSGLKVTLYNLLGMALVFFLINGYFIALSPASFVKNIFFTVSGFWLPLPQSTFGFAILKLYPVLLNVVNLLFLSGIILSFTIFAILGSKKLIFLFALLPLMLLFHVPQVYYIFFISPLIISLYMKDDTKKSTKESKIPEIVKRLAIVLIFIVILVDVALIFSSHATYEQYNTHVYNPSIVASKGYQLYDATLSSPNAKLGQVSVIEFTLYPNNTAVFQQFDGIFNKILYKPSSNVTYAIDPNRIYLTDNSMVNFSVVMIANTTIVPYESECILYNGNFYYICPIAKG